VSEPEYDVFDALGLAPTDSQRRMYQEWRRKDLARLSGAPKIGRSPWPTPSEYEAAGGTPLILHPDDYADLIDDILGPSWVDEFAEWEAYREATRAWANLGLRPTEHPDLYRVALVHAGRYRAVDVEPNWAASMPRVRIVSGRSVLHERDGLWLTWSQAEHYDAMMTSIRRTHEWQDSSIQLDS